MGGFNPGTFGSQSEWFGPQPSNQWQTTLPWSPTLQGAQVPPGVSNYPQFQPYPGGGDLYPYSSTSNYGKPSLTNSGDFAIESTINPFLTQDFMSYLQSQIGKGASPFDMSVGLPTGGTTAPGTLTAPENQVLQQLQSFFTTGQGGPPGTDVLAQLSKTGLPTDVGPMWEAMKAAQERNIQEKGANLREQFTVGGAGASSPYGTAAADYYSQAAKDQNEILAQASQQAQEAARSRQMGTSEFLTQTSQQLGELFQGMDQQAINNVLQEFIRTRPEYSPLLQMIFGEANTFPPFAAKPKGGGLLGPLLGGALGVAGSYAGSDAGSAAITAALAAL